MKTQHVRPATLLLLVSVLMVAGWMSIQVDVDTTRPVSADDDMIDASRYTPAPRGCIDTEEKAIAHLQDDVDDSVILNDVVVRVMTRREYDYGYRRVRNNYDFMGVDPDEPVWVIAAQFDNVTARQLSSVAMRDEYVAAGVFAYSSADGGQFSARLLGEGDSDYNVIQEMTNSVDSVTCP